jgi:hypothetical protein
MSRSVSNSLYKYNMCLLKELPAHREVDISRLTGAARGARIRNRQSINIQPAQKRECT